MEYCKECKSKTRFSEVFKRYFCKCKSLDMPYQPERSKREDYKVTTINSFDCPKIEMPIDKDILTKYRWDSIDAVL